MEKVRFFTEITCKRFRADPGKTYRDTAVLLLPGSYSEKGAPTRLVINCHGAGGTVTTDDSQIENQTLTQYLLANEYAVMDVNGLPEDFAEEAGIDIRNNVGCYFAVDSYVEAYGRCTDRFNLKKEVFVHGSSMGGLSSANLVLSGRIPVLAQTAFCPVLDTYREVFLHPWSDGLPKTALARIYFFDTDAGGDWVYDESRLAGFNPMTNGKKPPCPLLFCHSENDPVVDPRVTAEYVERAESRGTKARLLLLPGGGHEPQGYGDFLAGVSGTGYLDGRKLNITPAVEAVFSFITAHDPG